MKKASSSRTISPIGPRIRAARIAKDFSQEKLGVLIGLEEGSAGTRISRYENSIHEPAVGTSIALAKALNVPLAYLYCESDVLAALIVNLAKLSLAELQKIQKKL
ncbi:helix-turn-helix domain-containing protein [Polynucleobacter sp. UB-Raua-W9]|jgi:transcriptional regulator with XRE-family HTH domain|uniref:helix-turn-helix domain-containing protein n=1 Tax=Polynucleobacter sp. UB-Raua-W9 TaxID=1819736 RepID=UPI001BFECCCF|nr:helix-turn-helix transcriptional regulator [Polynucleobacter sp. UB-Raua-W9]QWD71587.1 helix-turn-helix transcriptional regulator [Polynucleobacter sp. UB-Raua-W9]